ncbi:MAG: hypothetical protein ABI462_12680 [Ignavibacteria bacterium]
MSEISGDPGKWNKSPEMTRIYTSGQYAPLPQQENIVFSDGIFLMSYITTSFSMGARF